MDGPENNTGKLPADMKEVKLFVPDDLYRAFQRCVWVLINETGRSQSEIMREVVQDFLVKHGC